MGKNEELILAKEVSELKGIINTWIEAHDERSKEIVQGLNECIKDIYKRLNVLEVAVAILGPKLKVWVLIGVLSTILSIGLAIYTSSLNRKGNHERTKPSTTISTAANKRAGQLRHDHRVGHQGSVSDGVYVRSSALSNPPGPGENQKP